MKLAWILLCKGITLALDRVHMDHHWSIQFLGPFQYVTQPGQVVSIDGPQIREPHVLKQRAARPERFLQRGFHFVIEAVNRIFHGPLSKKAPIPFFEMIVGRFGPQAAQMRGHGPYIWIYGHPVVVQDDDQRLARCTGIVQPLIGQTACQSTIPDQCQSMIVLRSVKFLPLPFQAPQKQSWRHVPR